MKSSWIDQAIERFGQPAVALAEPVIRFGLNRRCWAFGVDGQNFNVAIDLREEQPKWRYHVVAASPCRTAEIYTEDEPTDAEIRSVLDHAWPGYHQAVKPCADGEHFTLGGVCQHCGLPTAACGPPAPFTDPWKTTETTERNA